MQLNIKLSAPLSRRLATLTDKKPIYCIKSDIDKSGNFTNDFYLGATEDIIFVFDGEKTEKYPIADCRSIKKQSQTGGMLLILEFKGEELLLARSGMRSVSLLSSFARGAGMLINGNIAGRVVNNERERYCPDCGRILPGTAKCPKCTKDGRALRRIIDLCRPHKAVLVIITAMMLLDTTIALVKEYFLRLFMDEHLVRQNGTVADILLFLSAYVGMILVGLVIFWVKARLCGNLGAGVAKNLRGKLNTHLQKMSLSFLNLRNPGEIVERVTGDTARVREFITNSLCNSFNQIFTFLAVLIVMLVMNWRLALITFIFIPPAVIFAKTFWPKIHRIFHRQWRKKDSAQNKLQDVLSGIRIVKSYGKEKKETEEFFELNRQLANIQHKNERFFACFFPIITLVLSFSTYVIIYVGGLDVLGGEMTPGELMQFMAYAGMLLGPISWMTFLPRSIVNTTTALERIYDVLDEKPSITSKENAKKDAIKGELRLENVVFGYHSHEPVLDGVSLTVKPGEMMGLVGASGSGKSTLINLAMRLYDVDEGAVYVDGTDIRDIDTEFYHSQIGVVLQETFLFAGSVIENIAFAAPQATRKEIIAAAKAANAHDFITKLPDGYDTYIGEKGHKLSGGEKQRIAIARAILNNPRLLILDEATSSLDTESEYQVQQALERLRENRTTIAIAHRLSTLRSADKIAVIDEHKIAEFGTHNELLRKKGIYYSLVMAQLQMSKTAEDRA